MQSVQGSAALLPNNRFSEKKRAPKIVRAMLIWVLEISSRSYTHQN